MQPGGSLGKCISADSDAERESLLATLPKARLSEKGPQEVPCCGSLP